MNLFIALITGLPAKGLGCFAVQGGLMTTALAHELEKDFQDGCSPGAAPADGNTRPRIALPICLFLPAQLIAYTLLGFMLGLFGSLLQFTPLARALLMIAIGVFMLGNGLRLIDLHPVFRWFVIEPPPVVTRYIRRTSKKRISLTIPLLLGVLTVLLPCGVAQTVMAVALGSGDPLRGAGLMCAFTLGTMPIFFSIAFCATRLGAAMERYFTRFVALILIALGVVSISSGSFRGRFCRWRGRRVRLSSSASAHNVNSDPVACNREWADVIMLDTRPAQGGERIWCTVLPRLSIWLSSSHFAKAFRN